MTGELLLAGEWVDGFQSGKSTALLDWRYKREAEEFKRLCNALYWRKWRAENAERARAYVATYEARHPERVKRSRKKRKARYEARHPEKVAEQKRKCARAYYLRNRERILARVAARHRAQKDHP